MEGHNQRNERGRWHYNMTIRNENHNTSKSRTKKKQDKAVRSGREVNKLKVWLFQKLHQSNRSPRTGENQGKGTEKHHWGLLRELPTLHLGSYALPLTCIHSPFLFLVFHFEMVSH